MCAVPFAAHTFSRARVYICVPSLPKKASLFMVVAPPGTGMSIRIKKKRLKGSYCEPVMSLGVYRHNTSFDFFTAYLVVCIRALLNSFI